MKKLGIIAGLGVAATWNYQHYLPHATYARVPTGTFLFGNDNEKYRLIQEAVHVLRDSGCTHFAISCFSYQEKGNTVIRDLRLEVAADLHAVVAAALGTAGGTFTVIATSGGAAVLRHKLKIQGYYPGTRHQCDLDDMIIELAMSGLTDSTPIQAILNEAPPRNPVLIACTDLPREPLSQFTTFNVAKLHCDELLRLGF